MIAALATPHAWRLGDLLAGLTEPGPVAEHQVTTLTLDSRGVVPGALFLACQGPHRHGLAFAEDAARRGAAAILAEPGAEWPTEALPLVAARSRIPVLPVPQLAARASALADRFYGEPSAHLEVIAVSGTEGSSSASHLLAQVLHAELPCGLLGALGTGFADDLRPDEPGPLDAVTLQAHLAELRARGARAVVLELPPEARDRGWAAGVRLHRTLIADPLGPRRTEIGPAGQQGTQGESSTGREPSWTDLNPDASGSPIARGLRVRARGLQAAMEGGDRIWIEAQAVEPGPQGLRITVASSLGTGTLETGLIGARNARYLLAVLAVLLSRGLPLERALRRLAEVRGVPGRMESFGGDGAPLVVVDHGHTPDALEKALTDLRLHRERRVITVVGCAGDRDRGERPLMGAIAERLSDALILTDDNPGGEDGEAILTQILGGVSHPDRVRVERQRGLAIRLAIALAGTGDAVLVAGKGHETTQDLGDLKVHFSDRAQVVEALREWREGRH